VLEDTKKVATAVEGAMDELLAMYIKGVSVRHILEYVYRYKEEIAIGDYHVFVTKVDTKWRTIDAKWDFRFEEIEAVDCTEWVHKLRCRGASLRAVNSFYLMPWAGLFVLIGRN